MGNSWLMPRKTVAVDFFFVLSGFVIAYSYEARLRSAMSFRDFMLRRVIRLYPLMVLGALLGTAILLLIMPQAWTSWREYGAPVLAALGVPGPITALHPTRFPINPPGWSLFLEILAYISFGLLGARAGTRALAGFLVLALLGYAGTRAADFNDYTISNIFEALFAFYAGALVWRFVRSHDVSRIQLPTAMLGLVIIACCAIPTRLGWVPDVLCTALVFPAVLLSGAGRGYGRATRLERWLGDVSYPLYIIHWPFLLFAKTYLAWRIGAAATVFAEFAICITAATLALWVYDLPVRRWLTRTLVAGRPAVQPALAE